MRKTGKGILSRISRKRGRRGSRELEGTKGEYGEEKIQTEEQRGGGIGHLRSLGQEGKGKG